MGKKKTENPKHNHKTPKENRKTQLRITKLKTESQNTKQWQTWHCVTKKKCIALFRVCIKGSLSTNVLCASFVFIRDKPSWCEAKMISDATKFKFRKYVWDVGPILAYKECKSKKREKEKFSSENKRYDRRDVQDTFIKDSWCSNEASSNRSEGLSLLRLLHLIMFFDKFFLHHSPLVRHVRKFGLVVECIAVFFLFRRTDTRLYGRKNGPSHESFKSLISRKRHRNWLPFSLCKLKIS